MTAHDEAFGTLLRRYRHKAKLTQEELAENSGLSSKAIGALERGERRRPYKDSLERLATALGLSSREKAVFMAAARQRRAGESAPALFSAMLPVPLLPLVGRERELSDARSLFTARTRLLTLTGPGGVGKTRLAQQVALGLGAFFPDGIFFIDLADLKDAVSIMTTIAQALTIAEEEQVELLSTVQQSLRGRQILLCLDSCDHLSSSVGLVSALLTACPRIAVLATSRAALGLQGEQEMPIAPLALPDPHERITARTLADYPAPALFVMYVQRTNPDFQVDDAAVPIIVEICRQLDGLPLALELAAGWVRVLPLSRLLAQLSNRLALLKSYNTDLPLRHRTMRETIAWSYDLLNAHQQSIFRALAVFVGGCTLEAIRQICYASPASEIEAAEDMLSLVRQGLLLSLDAQEDGEPHFKMLETIHDFAMERLVAHEEVDAIQRRHAAWYQELAEAASQQLIGPAQQIWLARLKREHENLRRALQWAFDHHDPHMALRIAGTAWRYWQMHGYVSEGRRWLTRALASDGAATLERAEALNGLGVLACRQGDYEQAAGFLEESLALWRLLQQTQGCARALDNLGIALSRQGKDEQALRLHEESRDLFASVGDHHGMARSLNNLGLIAYRQKDDVRARTLYEQSRSLFVRIGDRHGEACALSNLGLIAYRQGDQKRARDLLEESLHLLRALGSIQELARSLLGLGILAQRQGEDAEAANLLEESLSLLRQVEDQDLLPTVLCELGFVVWKQGDSERATMLLNESLSLFQARGNAKGVALCQHRLAACASMHPET